MLLATEAAVAAAALAFTHQDLVAAGAKLAQHVSARVAQAAGWLWLRLAALDSAGPEPVAAGGLSRVVTRDQLRDELAREGRRWSERWLTRCLGALRRAGLAETVGRGRAGIQVRVLGLPGSSAIVAAPEGARTTPGDPAADPAAGRPPVAGAVSDDERRQAVAIRERIGREREAAGMRLGPDGRPKETNWPKWRASLLAGPRRMSDAEVREVLAEEAERQRKAARRAAGQAAGEQRRAQAEQAAAAEQARRAAEQRAHEELVELRKRLDSDARAKLRRTAEHELATTRDGWPPENAALRELLLDGRELDVLARRRADYERRAR